MMPYIRALLVAGALACFAPSILPAQGGTRCGEPELRARPRNFLVIDANTAAPLEGRARFRSGERMMVIIRNKNPFRYAYRTGRSTMPLSGVIASELITPLAIAFAEHRGPGPGVPSRQIDGCAEADRRAAQALLGRIDNTTKEIDRDLDALRKRIVDLVKGHDGFLKGVSEEKVYCERSLYESRRAGPALDELANPVTMIAELERIGDRVNTLARLYDALLDSMASRPASCRSDALDLQRDQMGRMRSNAAALLGVIKTIVLRRQAFLDLAAIVASVNENVFTDVIEPYVPEGATSITVEIFRRDLMVRNAPEVKVGDVRIDIDRPPAVSFSAGLGLSTVRDVRIGAIEGLTPGGGDTVGPIFGYNRNSVGTPSLVALLNVHLLRWTAGESFDMSLGVSAGTVLESDLFDGDPAYILGGTLGMLDDHLLVTLGLHWKQQEELSGGFGIGDPVPLGLTSIPVQGNYAAGLVFGVTGRVR